jgi:excisionase family DNA binding protein
MINEKDRSFVNDPLLTVSQVADIFQVTKATVRLWLNDGSKLKGIKVNTHWRIRQSEVTRFANQLYGD